MKKPIYQIGKLTFNTKNEITEKCRDIIKRNIKKDLDEDDLAFILELFKHHPDKEKYLNIKRIFVDIDGYGKNHCFYVQYTNTRVSDISFTKCITNIPFGEKYKIEFFLPFGKYKGQSIYDVFQNDDKYIRWFATIKLNRETKVKVNQFLRYGYVPFNPVAEKKKKHT